MITFLILIHLAMFGASVLLDSRRGFSRLKNLAIPPGLAFVYTSSVQAQEAIRTPAFDLISKDIEVALWISLVSYSCMLLSHYFTPAHNRNGWFSDKAIDSKRLLFAAIVLYSMGLLGYFVVAHAEGGLWAYFGRGMQTGSQFELSAYIYMLKYVLYGAIACLMLLLSLRRLPGWANFLLVFALLVISWDAIQHTDRGDTIRAGLLVIGWIFCNLLANRWLQRRKGLAYAAIGGVAIFIGCAVILLPEFRDTGRKFATSEVSIAEALLTAQAHGGASRFSANGGEFDSAARIIKRVNSGAITPSGPVQFARVIWTIIPRQFISNKWDIFDQWAGPNWFEVLIGSASYPGCVPTGWGESYGTMGFLGSLLYWTLVGFGLKKVEGALNSSISGLIVSLLCYLPLMQLVMMAFWPAAMTFFTLVFPVVVLLWFSGARAQTRQASSQKRKIRNARDHSPISAADSRYAMRKPIDR